MTRFPYKDLMNIVYKHYLLTSFQIQIKIARSALLR